MTHRIASLLLLSSVNFATGCIEQTDPATASNALTKKGGGGNPCPTWGCGANSPVVDTTRGFHELNLYREPNDAGMSLHNPAMVLDGRPYRLFIEDNRIVGRGEGGAVLSGTNLLGAAILIDTPEASPAYKIVIQNVHSMDFPFPQITPRDQLEVYVFGWATANDFSRKYDAYPNLCSNPPYPSKEDPPHYEPYSILRDPNIFSELLGMNPEEALIFAGDRINPTTKEMSKEASSDWFNIGCAGHTLAKLHLTRNTLASASPSVAAPTHAKRQATLKLLTADYCGTGRAFTVAGQPLQWKGQDNDALNYYFAPVIGLEARWNGFGAKCLTRPRMEVSNLQSAKDIWPNAEAIWTDIETECNAAGRSLPPPCDETDPGAVLNELRVSAHPGETVAPSPPISPTVLVPVSILSHLGLIQSQW